MRANKRATKRNCKVESAALHNGRAIGGLEINPSKSKVMHIGSRNSSLSYYINGTEIAAVSTEKNIGFWLRDDLSTSTHIQKARCKALAEISCIRRNFTYIDKRAFCTLYNQRIRPHLDYGMTACPPGTVAEAMYILNLALLFSKSSFLPLVTEPWSGRCHFLLSE